MMKVKKVFVVFLLIFLVACTPNVNSFKGDLISSYTSPNRKYVFSMYETKPALLDVPNCFGDVRSKLFGIINQKTRVFYQQKGYCKDYNVSWKDNQTIVIKSGDTYNIEINVTNSHYYSFTNHP